MTDSFYFVRQPLAGDGSITVRVTSLTGLIPPANGAGEPVGTQPGLQPWAKAGIIIKASTEPGSAYAAMMVTGGHGVRMQWRLHQRHGGPGRARVRGIAALAAADPLRRQSSPATTRPTARTGPRSAPLTLAGLPPTVQAGLFATSPAYHGDDSAVSAAGSATGGPTQATAAFDHVSLQGAWPGRPLDRRRRSGPAAYGLGRTRRVPPGRRPVHRDRVR